MKVFKIGMVTACLFGSVALVALAQAAPAEAQAGCQVAASLGGGGFVSNSSYSWVPSPQEFWQNWSAGFGDAAANFSCNNIGIQIDAALYGLKAGNQDIGGADTYYDTNRHFGGEVFWRDPNTAALGITVSNIEKVFSIVGTGGPFIADENMWRFGGFGQYFLNDQATIGASVNYLTGNIYNGQSNYSGFEASADLKYYVTDAFAVDLRGDGLASRYSSSFFGASFNGFAATAKAEYEIADLPLVLFAGGRYAKRQLTYDFAAPGTITAYTMNDLQGFVGARIQFGTNLGPSLRERDRHGTFDNTSVLQETLPGSAVAFGD